MTLKFAFIVGCLVFAVLSYFFCHSKRDWAWLVGGLCFTVWADYFLVLYNLHLPGVAVFCFAHVCYIGRSGRLRPFCMIGLFLTVGIIVSIGLIFESIFVLAGLYACLFIVNIFVHVLAFKKPHLPRHNHVLMLVGLCLFALCDMNVLVFNLPNFIDISFAGLTSHLAFWLIWFFYLPAQGLLAVSGIKFARRDV